jgi:hypothetical protein
MAGVNLPITGPLWIAQRIVEDLEISSERNPKDEVAHVENEKINSASPKIAKVVEKDLEGLSQMHKVKHQFHKNLIGGTNGLTMDDMPRTENSSQTVHINQGSGLPMTDISGSQGFRVRSTGEISEPKKNKDEIAVEDPHVRIEGDKIIVTRD